MTSPLISIGLPVVKSNFLKKSIECCLLQTYENIEILIQNNAKHQNVKDEIKNIVATFSDVRIKYFETIEQLPMVQNWNATLKNANGEFFSLLCDDDFWEPTFLEEMITLSEKYKNTHLFHSRIAVVDEQGKLLRLSTTCPEFEDGIDFIYHRLNGLRMTYLSDFVIRTLVIKEVGGFTDFPDGWGSDTFTWFKVSLLGGIAYSSKTLFNYRVSQINVSNSKNNRNKHIAIQIQYEMLKELIKSIEFSNDKYEIIRKEMLLQEINKFRAKSKKFIIFKILMNKYKLPEPIALIISLAYQYYFYLYKK